MQSKAKTVSEYIGELPDDRKEAIMSVRSMFLENIDPNIEEGMTYGMIGYYVPHRIFPAGYHCDPKQPLPYAGIASQKNHISIYLMSMYENSDEEKWLKTEWKKTGKKLDMGKCCIRFKRLDDIPLDVIGEAIRRLPSDIYIDRYTKTLASRPVKSSATGNDKKAKAETAKPTKASKKGTEKKTVVAKKLASQPTEKKIPTKKTATQIAARKSTAKKTVAKKTANKKPSTVKKVAKKTGSNRS